MIYNSILTLMINIWMINIALQYASFDILINDNK